MKTLTKILSGALILSSLIFPQKVVSQKIGVYIPKYVFIHLDENNEIKEVTKNNSGDIYDPDQEIVLIDEKGKMLPCPHEIKYKLNQFGYQRNNQLNEIEKKIADRICKDIDCPLQNIERSLVDYKVPENILEEKYQIYVTIDGDTNHKNIKEIKYKSNI